MRRVLLPILALAAPLVPVRSDAAPLPVVPRTQPVYQVGPEEAFAVPTREGAISVRLLRPVVPDGVRVPVILTLTAYGALSATNDELGDFFVPRGYARAVADTLGTGNSGGCWDYGGTREQAAAYDLVEALGAAEWSNGRVAMIGGSYDGTTANMAAVARPPSLQTIVPEFAISSWYRYAYVDGVRYFVADPGQRQGVVIDEQGFDTPLAFDAGYSLLPSDPVNPVVDPSLAERACPGLEKIEHTQRGYSVQPDHDAFWDARDYTASAGGVTIPAMVVGGWRDYNVKHSESTRMFEALGSATKMLVMSQAAHGGADVPGFDRLLHAWMDRWLYGHVTGVEAQRPVWTVGNDGTLRKELSWPVAPDETRIDLSSMAGASFTDGWTQTESEALAGPGDGHLLWASEPLASPLRIAGTPRLEIEATSDADTHLTPVLFDLGPPTSASPVCTFVPAADACTISRGFLDVRYRDGLAAADSIVPGEPYEASVRFIENDWTVPAGHRIGVALMSSNLWWAVPAPSRATTTVQAATLVLPVAG